MRPELIDSALVRSVPVRWDAKLRPTVSYLLDGSPIGSGGSVLKRSYQRGVRRVRKPNSKEKLRSFNLLNQKLTLPARGERCYILVY